jgi:hypothetical protein
LVFDNICLKGMPSLRRQVGIGKQTQFILRVSEHAPIDLIEFHEPAIHIDFDEGVHHAFVEPAVLGFGVLEGLLSLLAPGDVNGYPHQVIGLP